MKRTTLIAVSAAAALALAGYTMYRIGMQQGMHMASVAPSIVTAAQTNDQVIPAAAPARKPLYWHDPMVPTQKFDKPGKSPFMDMQLVPVYGADGGDDSKVTISPRVQQNMGIRTAVVVRGAIGAAPVAVGSVAYNERDVAVVQARSNGFVERLYVRATLDPVKQGQPLAQLYVPDWIAAQEEFLAARRIAGNTADPIVDGARQRMRLAGMSDAQIGAVTNAGRVQARLTLTAPVSGVVSELSVREGMTVLAGAPMFRINGLSRVWVNAELPENIAAQVRPGTVVEARTPALPGTVLAGTVGAILPEVNAVTRTVKARIELANPAGQLVPGMFTTLIFRAGTHGDVLLVPSEAVIQTGTRSVVMVASGDGKFDPVAVETGAEGDGRTEIRKGLDAGQKVVVSGQFLIDSEASLKGSMARMSDSTTDAASMPAKPVVPAAVPLPASGATLHHGVGKIESIGKDDITISHGPIATLQWGAMTMGFKLPLTGLPPKIAVGDTVAFAVQALKDGQFGIVDIGPAVSQVPTAGTHGSMPMSTKPTGAR